MICRVHYSKHLNSWLYMLKISRHMALDMKPCAFTQSKYLFDMFPMLFLNLQYCCKEYSSKEDGV